MNSIGDINLPHLQVNNVPESLQNRLKYYARRHNLTLSEIVLEALHRELMRVEFHEQLETRSTTELGIAAAVLLEEELIDSRWPT